jgi:hypothetical protein
MVGVGGISGVLVGKGVSVGTAGVAILPPEGTNITFSGGLIQRETTRIALSTLQPI